MIVKELVALLQQYPGDLDIQIRDGSGYAISLGDKNIYLLTWTKGRQSLLIDRFQKNF